MFTPDLDKANSIIESKTSVVIEQLKAEQAKYGIQHGPDGMDKVKKHSEREMGLSLKSPSSLRKPVFTVKKVLEGVMVEQKVVNG